MKKNIIISIIVGVFLIFLLYNFVNDNRKLTIIEKGLKDSVLFIEKIVDIPVSYVEEFIVDQKNKKDILKKYKVMKKQVEESKLIKDKYKETLKELNDLKENLNIDDSLIEYDQINAYAINRDVGYWYDTITLNKGEMDGIKEGMAVINSKGLIGKITKISYTTSTIKLLTGIDLNNKISVKIEVEGDYLYGLLSSYQNNLFIIEGISDNREIKEGSIITTTGLDSVFPSGVNIGVVSKTSSDNFDLTRTVYMKSSADFDNINYVIVLKRKQS